MRAKLDIYHRIVWYESDSDLDKSDDTFAVAVLAPPNVYGKTTIHYPGVPSYSVIQIRCPMNDNAIEYEPEFTEVER